MRQVNLKECVILALNTGSVKRDKEILGAHGFNFKELVGCHKGETEDSYLIIIEGDLERNMILRLAKTWSQEPVLFLRPDRSAYLYYIETGVRQDLGKFVEAPRKQAWTQDAWTLDLKTQRYYITEGV